MKAWLRWGIVSLFSISSGLHSVAGYALSDLDYGLQAQQIAKNTYVFMGLTEDFTFENGGNIINTGFIVTQAGIIVIDDGSSFMYGRQMRAAIEKISPQPIVKVINTAHHPDHFFGNQAFPDVSISATATTIQGMLEEGEGFANNLYRMVGDWMRDTQPTLPTETLIPGEQVWGEHTLRFIEFKGHTASDLVVLDATTGVLFTGSLVFYNRTPTTTHADIPAWLETLAELEKLPFKLMVPGHGEVVSDNRAIAQTRDYLTWLLAHLNTAANQGLAMAEVLETSIPARFDHMALNKVEFTRSVAHLYPTLELAALPQVADPIEF